ncbi:hypothetical protein NZK35_11075 [Stieleria sp. ICT_E10.1]|uniref:hypothetical protein n=1 Tax=Stieleria sedimenti TaxID=2976331 RepID=UPI00217FD820|nr:hypothetical protein [Stieleria sedimenti]MCS7467185.1 hypothetical protein [Stieleria sedimenti]
MFHRKVISTSRLRLYRNAQSNAHRASAFDYFHAAQKVASPDSSRYPVTAGQRLTRVPEQ